MSIPMNSHCVDCLLKKHNATARSLGSDEDAYRLSKGVMQLILDAAPEESSAVVGSRVISCIWIFLVSLRIGTGRKKKCPTAL